MLAQEAYSIFPMILHITEIVDLVNLDIISWSSTVIQLNLNLYLWMMLFKHSPPFSYDLAPPPLALSFSSLASVSCTNRPLGCRFSATSTSQGHLWHYSPCSFGPSINHPADERPYYGAQSTNGNGDRWVSGTDRSACKGKSPGFESRQVRWIRRDLVSAVLTGKHGLAKPYSRSNPCIDIAQHLSCLKRASDERFFYSRGRAS